MKSNIQFANENIKKTLEKLKTKDKKLYELLIRAFNDIEENVFCGIQIPKKLIPKEYIEKYELNNLWKTNLPSYWRMYYTLSTTRLEILTVLITFEDHEEYDKRFKYKKR